MQENIHHPFRSLFQIDVNRYVEKKGAFSYLSWPFAVAQLRLREGRAQEGIPFALQALLLNEQTSNTSGVAKCLMVLTQCSRAAGDLESARAYAERCIAVNESMGNAQGVESARWQLDRLDER